MQGTHTRDIVIGKKAQDEVAFAAQIAAILVRKAVVFRCGAQQQLLQRQHLPVFAPRKQAAHQHQQRAGVGFERLVRAVRKAAQHILRVGRGQLHAHVLRHHAQPTGGVAALLIGCKCLQVLPALLVPRAVAVVGSALRFRTQTGKHAPGAGFHHVVEAISAAVRQAGDKGVLLGQAREHCFHVVPPRDAARHFGGEFVRKAHHGEEFLLVLRKRIDQRGGKHLIDVGIFIRKHAALRKGAKAQIDGGKPALARAQQRIHLPVGQRHAAFARVDGKLRVVQPQLIRADAVQPPAQPHDLRAV